MSPRASDRSLARQVLVLQALLIALIVGVGLGLAIYETRIGNRERATERALAVASSVADTPDVLDAVRSPNPTAALQDYAERVRHDTGVDFVVIMDLQGRRYTHPDPAQIGGQFVGGLGDAPRGVPYTQEYAGTLGPSMRAVVPVTDDDQPVALVAVGITIEKIQQEVWRGTLAATLAGLAVLAFGVLGALVIYRRLGRQTHGLSARELTRMYEYHQAVLYAVREGLLLLDSNYQVQLVNDEARRLLDLPADAAGLSVRDLGLPPALVEAAVGGRRETDDVYLVSGRALVVSSMPARRDGRLVGTVVTVRDRTELQSVSGELGVVRRLTAALRAQNHESANRLHTVVSLVEMGRPEEAIEFATEELQIAQLLTDHVVASVDEPVLSALLLGKNAEAAERGVTLEVEADVTEPRLPVDGRTLVTIAGNLIDNALDAVGAPLSADPMSAGSDGADSQGDSDSPRVHVHVLWNPHELQIAVSDNGPGIAPEDAQRVLQRGWSTKAGPPGSRGIGLALVAQLAQRQDGGVRIDRSDLGGALLTVTLREGS